MKRLYTSLLLATTLSTAINIAFADDCSLACKQFAKQQGTRYKVPLAEMHYQYIATLDKPMARLTGSDRLGNPTYEQLPAGKHNICTVIFPPRSAIFGVMIYFTNACEMSQIPIYSQDSAAPGIIERPPTPEKGHIELQPMGTNKKTIM